MKNLVITLDAIRAELGEKMAHLLTNHFSGRRIQIPSFCDETCTLTAALGINAARILSERFGGGVIDVPTGSEHRRREIARLRRQGKNPAAIARQVGCTQRYVCDVLAEQRYRARHSGE